MLHNRHRIIAIEGVPSCGSLLIAMFRDDDGDDYVELSAWHKFPEREPVFQIEKLYFDSDSMSEKFIKDYSIGSAEVFVSNFYAENVNKQTPKKRI